MTNLMAEAFEKVQNLPDYLQDEIAAQLIEDIENERQWQDTLSRPIDSQLETMALRALENSKNGECRTMGFDEL